MSATDELGWPDNKTFAFTICDDTDFTTLHNGPVVYDFLQRQGIRTTKSVWMFDGERRPGIRKDIGTTCEDKAYLDWVLQLQEKGFEIASHGTSFTRSSRERIIAGLEAFRSCFGDWPRVLAQHNDKVVSESIYWGENRVSGNNRRIYKAFLALKRLNGDIFHGEREGSPYFWGDICRDHITYVRNFVYRDINTLRACPMMPYHDPKRPYVKYWFASTEAPNCRSFVARLSKNNLDRLQREHGACILYTHFGSGFATNGQLSSGFQRVIGDLANRNGWFVPVSVLLDHVLKTRGHQILLDEQRRGLERKWLLQKLFTGRS